MFRKLYWVTETVDPDGHSRVTGVYTSIPDLIQHGLSWSHGRTSLRITLSKLDSEKEPFGCWTSPSFKGLEDELQAFVRTDEFSPDHCKLLLEALSKLSKKTAA